MSNSGTLNNTYTNYTNKMVALTQGSTYTATGNFSTNATANDFYVWIDYNNDAEFSLNERVIADKNTGNTGTGSFTIPYTTVADTVLMRVRLGSWPADSIPCGTYWGEVEDYYAILKTSTPLTLDNIILNGVCSDEKNYLDVIVSSTQVPKQVEIQRSYTGVDFETIAVLKTPFNISPLQVWKYVDESDKNAFYRSIATSHDGKKTNSEVIIIPTCKLKNVIYLYPNPVVNELKIASTIPIQYEIFNSLGQIIQQGEAYQSINVSALSPGMYFFFSEGIKIEFVKL
jgi:hypothetical protein